MSSDQRRILGRRIVQPAASPTMPGKVVRKKKSRSMLTPTSEVSLPLRSEVKEAKVEPVQREETRVAENKEEFRNETVSFILKQREIDLGKLQRRCWHGIEPQFRAKAWLVLLGVVPRQHGRQSDVLGRRIREYAHFVSEYRANLSPDHYGRLSPEVAKAFHQIDLDLPRTNPSSRLFQCKRARDCIQRVLRVYSVRHPATGYVQGMNDLITPLIYVFTADEVNSRSSWNTILLCIVFDEYSEAVDEALEHVTEERWIAIEGMVFVCLCRILDGIQDHFTRDQPGIQRKLYQVSELVTRLNPALATFLDDIGVQWNMFAYRWMVCFLVRQLGPKYVFV